MISKRTIGHTLFELCQGDITDQVVDAIVNAANSRLAGGGGVDGAIHRAGGPSIMDECRQFDGCPTGSAVATGAGRLQARYVIHTVGPIWTGGGQGEPELLKSAYHQSLKLALEKGARTVAFPAISTGVYGYPVDQAAKIAIEAVVDFVGLHEGLDLVRFVLFSQADGEVFERVAGELLD